MDKKDSSSLPLVPLVDEVQDRLKGCATLRPSVWGTGRYLSPMEDKGENCLLSGSGLGLYQFSRMPFGLTKALLGFNIH